MDRAIRDYNQALRPVLLRPTTLGAMPTYKGDMTSPFTSTRPSSLAPTMPTPTWLGNTYSRNGEYDRAIRAFDQAIHLAPNLTDAYLSRGMFLQHAQGEAMIAPFKTSTRPSSLSATMPPTTCPPPTTAGECSTYRSKGEFDRAIRDFDRVIRLQAQLRLRCLCLNRGDWPTEQRRVSIAPFKTSTRPSSLTPTTWTPTPGRGATYRSKGQYDRAIQDFDQALRDDVFTRHNRGHLVHCG